MVIQDFRPVVMLVVSLAYLVLAGQVIVRRQVAPAAARLLVAYVVVAAAWALLDTARYWSWLANWPADVTAQLPLYAALSLSIVFLDLTRAFLPIRRRALRWYWLGAACLVVVVLIDSNLLGLPHTLLRWPGWFIGRTATSQALLTVGWGLFVAVATRLTIQAYRRTAQPLHRNRLAYWSLAIALEVAGMAVLLVRQDVPGNVVLLLAALTAALGVVTHHLPDVRQALRGTVVYLATIALAIGVFATAILLVPAAQRLAPGLSSLAVALVLATILALMVNPVLGRVQQRLRLWASGSRYDARRIVGEYSLTIGGILKLDHLADVALNLIREAINIDRGALFVVDPPTDDPEVAHFFGLRLAGALGTAPPSGALLVDSPAAAFLTQELAPLTQYELDLNRRFRTISAAERLWLQSLGMDVYVPIYAGQRWIGLFALGPKLSHQRYFDNDLQLLSTLADQTAVALQNARLVDGLVQLNAQIKDANTALDQANQRLAHLDRIKSDFINIISHELRTPLSILYGYARILLGETGENGDAYHRQLVEGINSGATRMQEIIEDMLEVTKIDTRALVLSATPVSIESVITKVLSKLSRPLAERDLQVEMVNLGTLPPVDADAAALAKVFQHLMVNALKFTPDGGRITVTGRCLDGVLPGGAVEIAIRDTGIGIDPRFLDLIFTKFYQMGEVALHSSSKTKFKGGGPGLGLAIARGIVEAHGGRLRAESSGYDETNLPGSRFIVLLPLTQATRTMP